MAGHRCKQRELSVLLTYEDEEDIGAAEGKDTQQLEADEYINPEVSLNSVIGLSSSKTMKLKGNILGSKVIVMIDPGATHNFISIALVEKLGIPVLNTKEFGVSLGNGEAVRGSGECRNVLLHLDTVDIVQEFLPFMLGNPGMILGVQWMEKLGAVTTNWKS